LEGDIDISVPSIHSIFFGGGAAAGDLSGSTPLIQLLRMRFMETLPANDND